MIAVAIADQVQEIRLHLIIGDLVGRSAIVLGQTRDRRQIRLAGPLRHSAHDHVVIHPSVVVASSSHTSVMRRREHQRSAATIEGLCDGERRTAAGERRTGTYRDQRFSLTPRAEPRRHSARAQKRRGSAVDSRACQAAPRPPPTLVESPKNSIGLLRLPLHRVYICSARAVGVRFTSIVSGSKPPCIGLISPRLRR